MSFCNGTGIFYYTISDQFVSEIHSLAVTYTEQYVGIMQNEATAV
jgi:hypothetical protein